MANLMLATSGISNFTGFSGVDTTSFLNSEASSTALTTAFVGSSSFTPGAINVTGIAVKIASRAVSPSGTMSIRLFNVTGAAAVAGSTVTINVSDINAKAGGWYLFPMSITTAAATVYRVEATTSVAAQVNLFRDATANNWSRMLRGTNAGNGATGDYIVLAAEYVSAGVVNTATVQIDADYSATVFGQLDVCAGVTLSWNTTGATNYLKISGNLNVYAGGTLKMGDSGTPVPSTTQNKLEFVCATNVVSGLEIRAGGSLIAYGNPKTISTQLAADAAISATSLTTSSSTGWITGDRIAISGTTRTAADAEQRVLQANASGATLTLTAGLTVAHSGTSPIQAFIVNLTRNVQIFSSSTTLQTYLNVAAGGVVDLSYVELYNMGSATASKRGVDCAVAATGSFSVQNCALHDFTVTGSTGINVSSTTAANITLQNNVFNLINGQMISIAATVASTITVTGNIGIRNVAATSVGFSFTGGLNGTITGNIVANTTGSCIVFSQAIIVAGTINSNQAYGGGAAGFLIQNILGGMIGSTGGYRNSTYGVSIDNTRNTTIASVVAFGNATANVGFLTTASYKPTLSAATLNAGTTLTCPVGIAFATSVAQCMIDTTTMGATTTHATGDVNIATANIYVAAIFRNCLFNSTTPLANQTNLADGSKISSARHNQTAGSQRSYKRRGTMTLDTVIFGAASPSQRLTPNTASSKLEGSSKLVLVPNGSTASVSVRVRKSVVGDGTAYTGAQPRLIVKANPAVGITSDTVLATASGAAGSFETLTGTTPTPTDNAAIECIVDCDGVAGWVNIDDWSVV